MCAKTTSKLDKFREITSKYGGASFQNNSRSSTTSETKNENKIGRLGRFGQNTGKYFGKANDAEERVVDFGKLEAEQAVFQNAESKIKEYQKRISSGEFLSEAERSDYRMTVNNYVNWGGQIMETWGKYGISFSQDEKNQWYENAENLKAHADDV